jgi:shikimate dehydrogenase
VAVREPRRCAVIGSPIAHSLSPALHRAAYRRLGLDWRYDRHEVTVGSLPAFVAGLDTSWRGLSCTMPLKRAILALGRPDATAAALGVANTVVFDGEPGDPETTSIHNTDVTGFTTALSGAIPSLAPLALSAPVDPTDTSDLAIGAGATPVSAVPSLAPALSGAVDPTDTSGLVVGAGATALPAVPNLATPALPVAVIPTGMSGLVLGAGATALSAVLALARLGVASVQIAARDPVAAQGLAARARDWGVGASARALDEPWEPVDVAVSTVPAPVSAALAARIAAAAALVFDVLYDPWPTPLTERAQALGRATLTGRDLLAHQAAGQVELMTGRGVPVQVLLDAMA